MPTWTAPRLPPPARTKAVRFGAGRLPRPSLTVTAVGPPGADPVGERRRWCWCGAGDGDGGGEAAPARRFEVIGVAHDARSGRVRRSRRLLPSYSCLLACPPGLPPGHVVAHRPHDHDDRQRRSSRPRRSRRSRRRRCCRPTPAGGRMPCPPQGRGAVTPRRSTLQRWFSSHPGPCSGQHLRVTLPADRGTGAEVLALLRGDAGGPPPFRSRAGRGSAGLAGGCRLRRRHGARRARAAPLPRAAPVARLARRGRR